MVRFGFQAETGLIQAGAFIGIIPGFAICGICVFCQCCPDTAQNVIFGLLACLGFFSLLGGSLLIAGGATEKDELSDFGGVIACGFFFLLAGCCHCVGCGLLVSLNYVKDKSDEPVEFDVNA